MNGDLYIPAACFDSHAHYDDARFDTDRGTLLAALPGMGVGRVINAASSVESSRASVALAEAFAYIRAAVGVHPHEAGALDEAGFSELEKLLADADDSRYIAAIGEIGLDYYYDNAPREAQRYWFKRQLALAGERNLPAVIHSREAAAETFGIIKDSGVRRGVIHCYSGGAQMAMDYIKMGFFIGVGGAVTFEKSKKTREAVKEIPLEYILIETDAPYLTPAPHRGKRNDSSYLKYITGAIAEIKHITPGAVAETTYKNAEGLFT